MLWTRTLFDEHHDSPLMKVNHIFSVRRVGALSQPWYSSARAAMGMWLNSDCVLRESFS